MISTLLHLSVEENNLNAQNNFTGFLLQESLLFSLSSTKQVLVDARDKLGIPWEDPDRQEASNHVMSFQGRSTQLDPPTFLQYLPSIVELWKDKSVQTAYDRRREFQLVSFIYIY